MKTEIRSESCLFGKETMRFRGIITLFETKSTEDSIFLNTNLQSLHILNTKWKIGGAVTVASAQKLKKQGSVNKERTFVVVSCLPNESKLFISFDFVLD